MNYLLDVATFDLRGDGGPLDVGAAVSRTFPYDQFLLLVVIAPGCGCPGLPGVVGGIFHSCPGCPGLLWGTGVQPEKEGGHDRSSCSVAAAAAAAVVVVVVSVVVVVVVA